MTDANDPVDDKRADDEAWREGLPQRVRALMFAVLAIGGLTIFFGARGEGMRVFGIVVFAVALVLVVVLASKRLSLFVRAMVEATLASGR